MVRGGTAIAVLVACWATGGAVMAQSSVQKQSLSGRYGLDAAACKAKDYFATLTETSIDLPTYSCTGVSFDQVEARGGTETYQVTATACTGEMAAKGKSDRFLIVRSKGTIRIHWGDGTRGAELLRCGA